MWQASLPRKAASLSSSSTWKEREPLEERAPLVLVPHLRVAALAASMTLG